MQSGITASKELQDVFQRLLTDSSLRGLVASISKSPESLVPGNTVPSTSSNFSSDLANLQPLIEDKAAAYIILRQDHGGSAASGRFIAVTYVPDEAPVRQKMLFASTRLTLVRELGSEHFGSTFFITSKTELTAEGWAKHEAHSSLAAPLTQEERDLVGIREAEAQESTGTSTKRGGHLTAGMDVKISDEATGALKRLKDGSLGVVQLQIDIPSETLHLTSTQPAETPASALQGLISRTSPRYTFYTISSSSSVTTGVSSGGGGIERTLFIYTCPSTASIKERMLYASMRRAASVLLPQRIGLEVSKSIETGAAEDVTESLILEELSLLNGSNSNNNTTSNSDGNSATTSSSAAASASQRLGAPSGAFARPKRPGARR